jgi:hypothetical protein
MDGGASRLNDISSSSEYRRNIARQQKIMGHSKLGRKNGKTGRKKGKKTLGDARRSHAWETARKPVRNHKKPMKY